MNYAIIGLMGSGKSSVAQDMTIEGYQRLAFAQPVKEIAHSTLMASLSLIRTEEANAKVMGKSMDELKAHPSIRGLLQYVGTELGRNFFGESTWIDIMEKEILFHKSIEKPVVVDDCRFLNEASMLDKNGFYLVRVVRDEEQRRAFLKARIQRDNPTFTSLQTIEALMKMLNHPSETEISLIQTDVTLYPQDRSSLAAISYCLARNDYKELEKRYGERVSPQSKA